MSFSEKFNSIPLEDNGLYSVENADAVVRMFKEEGSYYPHVLGAVYDSYIAGGITESDNISWIGAQAVGWLDNMSQSETYMISEIDYLLDYGSKFKQFMKEDQTHIPGFLQEVGNSKQKISDDAQAAWEQWNMITQKQAEDENYHPDYKQILQILESLRTKTRLHSHSEDDDNNINVVNKFVFKRFWELTAKRGNFSDIDLQDIDSLLPYFSDSVFEKEKLAITDKKAMQESGQDFEFELIEDLLKKSLLESGDMSLDELLSIKDKLSSYTEYNGGVYKDKIDERLKKIEGEIKQRQQPAPDIDKNKRKEELAQLKTNTEFKFYDPFQLNEKGELAYEVFREDYERFNAVVFTDDEGKALEGEELEKARQTLKETIIYEAKSKSLAFTGKQENINNTAECYYVNIKNSLHKALFATEFAQIQQDKSLDTAAKAEAFKKIVSRDYDESNPAVVKQSSLIQYAGMVNAEVNQIRDRLKAKFGRIPAVKSLNKSIKEFDGKMKNRYGQKWEISKRISLSIFKSAKNVALYSTITAMSGTMAPYAMGALAIKNAFDTHKDLKAQAQSENLTFKEFYNRHPGKVWKSYSLAALGGAAAAVGLGTQHFSGSKETIQGVQKALPWLTRTLVLVPKLAKTGFNVYRLKKAQKNKADAEVIAKLQAKCNECYLETTEAVISVGAGIGLNHLVGGYINKMFSGIETPAAPAQESAQNAEQPQHQVAPEQPAAEQQVSEPPVAEQPAAEPQSEQPTAEQQHKGGENPFGRKEDAIDKMFKTPDLSAEIPEGTKIEDPSNPYNPHNYKPAEAPTPQTSAPDNTSEAPATHTPVEEKAAGTTPDMAENKAEEVSQSEQPQENKVEAPAPVHTPDPHELPNDKALEHFKASFEQEATSYSNTVVNGENINSYQLPNGNVQITEHNDGSTTVSHSYASGAQIDVNLNADGTKTETITDAHGEQTVINYDAEGNRQIPEEQAAKTDEVSKRLDVAYKKLDELNQLKEGETQTHKPASQQPITAQNINTPTPALGSGGSYYS